MHLYERYEAQINPLRVDAEMEYEVHLEPEEYKQNKRVYVLVGVEVTSLSAIPLELFGMVLPKTCYAAFTFKGKEMFQGGAYIWRNWLPTSDYEEAFPFMIDSELDWMIPIMPKSKK